MNSNAIVPSRKRQDIENEIYTNPHLQELRNPEIINHYFNQVACPVCGLMFDFEDCNGRSFTHKDVLDCYFEKSNNQWFLKYRGRLCEKCHKLVIATSALSFSNLTRHALFQEQLQINPNLYLDLISYRGYYPTIF